MRVPLWAYDAIQQVQCMGGRLPVFRSPWEALCTIKDTQGASGLFRGAVPLTLRLVPYTIVSFYVYDAAKSLLSRPPSPPPPSPSTHASPR